MVSASGLVAGRHQIEAAGLVALLLEAPIPDFAEAVEGHCLG